jgi:1-pyrroline-5-carboxylate dehydrogenase
MLIAPFRNEPFDLFDTESAKADMQQALKKMRSEFDQTHPLVINSERVQTEAKLVSTNSSNPDEIVGYTAKATTQHGRDVSRN